MPKRKPKNEVGTSLPVERQPEPGQRRIDVAKAWKLRVVNRLSFSEIAETLHCSKSTVHAALERLHKLLPDPELVQAYESVEPYILTAAKEQLLASLMDPEAIAKATLNNRAFAFSQVANHERLAKAKSTTNTSIMHSILDQAFAGAHESKAVESTESKTEDGERFSITRNPQAETALTPQDVVIEDSTTYA